MTSGNNVETGPLNYSHTTMPMVLAGICNCQTTPHFRPDDKFQSSDVILQVYVDDIARHMFDFGGEKKLEMASLFVYGITVQTYSIASVFQIKFIFIG